MEETTEAKTSGAALTGLEATFNEWFVKKAPFQLPKAAKDWIVQWSPWITLVILIILAPAVLVVLGLGTLVGGFAAAAGVTTGAFYWLAFVALLAQLVVMAISIPKLMKRDLSGWKLLYYSNLVNFAYNVLHSMSNPLGFISGLIGAAIGAAISLYILFQIRSYYR